MSETLNISTKLQAFEGEVNSNPPRMSVSWTRNLVQVPVQRANTLQLPLAPGETQQVFDGRRTLTANGSTGYQLTLSPLPGGTRYRLAWTGAGAAPGFRIARSVAVAVGTVDLTLLANQTLTVTSSLGGVFGAVQVGDVALLPGVITGDPSVYDPLNEGEWTVLGATSTLLTLARFPGAVFSGVTQAGVAIGANSKLQVYGSAGVQVGDTLDLVAGFSAGTLGTYPVVAVTASSVDFQSTLPLAAQSVVPGASGVAAYARAKLWVRVESDQDVVVAVNGDTSGLQRVEPFVPGNPDTVGWYDRAGTHFSLSVTNASTAQANVTIHHAE